MLLSHRYSLSRVARPVVRPAFTMLELLVTIVILIILLALIVPVFSNVRKSQRSVQCIAKLQSIGLAFQSYALDHHRRLPDPGLLDKSWEQLLQPYHSAGYECPEDQELYPAVGSSYDWRDTGVDTTTLAGKTLDEIQRPDAVFAMEAMPGWHTAGSINVVRADGSATTVNAKECFKDLTRPLRLGIGG